MCIRMGIYNYISIYLYAYMHTHACACLYAHENAGMSKCMDACMCLHICCNNLLARKIQTKSYGKSRQNLDKVGPKPA